jgi:thioredoxin reductase/bacterioferritin-associated ferredoxin
VNEVPAAPDVAIVGAGPAGLAAGAVCARAGLTTVLLDEQQTPGGQIYRAAAAPAVARVLGADDARGAALVQEFFAGGARYVPRATVWCVTPELEIGVSVDGSARLLSARRVILATGALERPFPIPGWTLPGVMTAGAAQILLKANGLAPRGRTVLAGCGPLLWQLAAQYLRAGVRLECVLETTPRANRVAARAHLRSFLASPYVGKGLALLARVRGRVPIVRGVTALHAEGERRVERVVYRCGDRAQRSLAVDTLLLHQGVVPHVNLALAAGVEHRWDDAQACFVPVLDAYGNSSVPGIAIAGDAAGIAGAQAAEERGRLAAIAAVRALKPGAPLADEATVRRRLRRCERGRAFLDALYRPPPQFRLPGGATIVCRCEEVSAQQVLEAVALGCAGPNQVKAFTRCGMGPCQGRLCGLTVTELIAAARGVSPQEVGYYRLRPPAKPVTVGELAALPTDEAALATVVRL